MKIAGYQLENTIARQLKPAYLLTGDDAFLRHEALTIIQEAAAKHGFTDKMKWIAQEDPDNELLSNILFSQSLFQSKELIELDFGDKFPTAAQQIILQNALKNPDHNKLMVIQSKKLDEKIQKTAWFRELDNIGLIITIWPLSYDQLKIFIATRAKKYRMTIDMDATTLLADLSEGNVNIAAQTLEKIQILDERHITEALIRELLHHDNAYTIFDLSDALLVKDTARMLRILDNLQDTGTEPTLVLWSLTREIRVLIDCLIAHNEGGDLQTVFKKQRVLTKKQEVIRRRLQHHSLSICYRWLQHAFLIDQKIKHFFIADVWRELHIFCLRAS